MAKPFTIVGTKPPRPHWFAEQIRCEVRNKVPMLRVRNDDEGMIFQFKTVGDFRSFAEAMLGVADHLEKDDVAAAEKQAIDWFNKAKGNDNAQ